MAKRSREDSSSSRDDVLDKPASASRSHSQDAPAHALKYASLEKSSDFTTMRCLLPPHKPLRFSTYDEYETHYRKDHTNRCLECNTNLPTAHFLELHLAENHDPIVASRRDSGEKTFTCFVEDCEKVCSDWKKRRSHLVDKHGYPKNYDFLLVNHGIDGRRSMLRPGVDSDGHRKSSRERERRASSATETTESTEATSVSESDGNHMPLGSNNPPASSKTEGTLDSLTQSMSALNMVPRSITFGRRKGMTGLSKE